MKARYTIHLYSQHFFCIDCEDCQGKICNFTPSDTSGEIMDKINAHERRYHESADKRSS